MDVTLAAGSAWTDPACPVARTVDLIGDRWSLLIIRDAMDGATTFTEFLQRLGIARNILTDRLRKLVEHGILDKSAAGDDGRRHTYRLTEAGQDLFTAVVALRQWGERHAFAPDEPHSVLVDGQGRELAELRPLSQDGAPLSAEASHVRKIGVAAP
ncbi:winged helix-turn-helix transcriptional regulator [Nonomuraea jabiensis]|uniref:DNA-binding HxlR family transcriptional regulator n=1 Tax=Nonomuraea jabiensis TaxID=882448 RepID=A0A7W9G7X4_9ACTN|nr:helix-turn-helix domain-containing protein [Nonomuraea jabiensis]MBB5778816.1 DNA-binding HxlR family transcriptional regulator [Nonomuraea jabiensis]